MEKEKKKTGKHKFTSKMQRKLVVVYVIGLLAFAGLSVRLVWLATEKENQYQKQVLSQQQYASSIIPYRRGDIVDANGTKLATSEKVYNLVVDAKVMQTEIGGKKPYLEPTLKALEEYFDTNMTVIRNHVEKNKNSSWYVPSDLKKLKYDQISGFLAAQEENSKIRGVWFEEEYLRVYPYDSLASGAIGFTTADGVGSYGLEEYYNSVLSGVNGREYGYLNDDLDLERTVKAAIDGNTIHSTIDINLQLIVEKYLKEFMDEHKNEFKEGNGAEGASCVIMDVNTGAILAMADYPNYNLNFVRDPKALIGSKMVEQVVNANGYYEIRQNGKIINQKILDEMTDSELYLNLNQLWKNYCITTTYEPGSTIKPFTVAAALETASISPNASYTCDGVLHVGDYDIKCHSKYHGTLTLKGAIAKSCNVAMMKIGMAMGADIFTNFQNTFNFGLKTNIDLAGEARTDSLIYKKEEMRVTDLATNAFGQNFNVTMIQMISGFCSLINGGYYYEPHMINKITNASGAVVENIEPRILKQTISESTSDYIRAYCEAVVSEGTGKSARPAGYSIGGKTGTAETIDQNTHTRSEDDRVVSFIGYAPADNPQIAIYVVVDRPNVEEQGESAYATQIVRKILTEALPSLNIFMTESLTEEEKQELEALKMEITLGYGQKYENENVDDSPLYVGEDPLWMSFPLDKKTGYRVDPATGEFYDAQTGAKIGAGETNLGNSVPVNPNL